MPTTTKTNSRLLWLALILLLPSVYLHAMVPHHHAEPEHTHTGDVPEPLGQLPHSHDEADGSGQDAHHCRLTNHLDSHTYAVPDREQDHDLALEVGGLVDIPALRPAGSVVPDRDGRDPDIAPLAPGAPRAPPQLG